MISEKSDLRPVVLWRKRKTFLIQNFLSPLECKHLIDYSETKGYEKVPFQHDKRTNTRLFTNDSNLATVLWSRAKSLIPSTVYTPETKMTWYASCLNPGFRFCRYTKDQFFVKHYDEQKFIKGEKSFYTMMMYLNNVPREMGGTTRFYKNDLEETFDFEVSPVQGSLILLWQKGTLHDGAPLQGDTKYILRTEVMYRKKSD